MSYTKGPWVFQEENGTIYIGPLDRKTGRVEAIVTSIPFHPARIPNARLIASAPDILQALDLVMTWVRNWSPEFTQDDEWAEDEEVINAAISKAKWEDK